MKKSFLTFIIFSLFYLIISLFYTVSSFGDFINKSSWILDIDEFDVDSLTESNLVEGIDILSNASNVNKGDNKVVFLSS